MRCTHCGLPLSPSATDKNCPRCHARIGSEPLQAGQPIANNAQRDWGDGILPKGWQGRAERAKAGHSTPPAQPQGQQMPFPETYSSQAGQMWRSGSALAPTPVFQHAPQPLSPGNWTSPLQRDTKRNNHPTRTNSGFIVASACVITGALLLTFVYFIAATLPTSSTSSTMSNKTASISTQAGAASPTTSSRQPTVTPSPSATSVSSFPAQQYIDNPQTASTINTATAQPLNITDTFKVGQRVYVTFTLHPNGQSGSVCLLWYLNSSIVNHFEFTVLPASTVAYAYTYYGAIGKGYVNIYWASSTACSDKQLAQRVDFIITR